MECELLHRENKGDRTKKTFLPFQKIRSVGNRNQVLRVSFFSSDDLSFDRTSTTRLANIFVGFPLLVVYDYDRGNKVEKFVQS